MPYSDAARSLATPRLKSLGRLDDRITFLLIDQARIEQTRTGVEAWHNEGGESWRTSIPTANLALLALGPGVSITTPALSTLHRAGTTVVVTSADGLCAYCTSRPLTSSAKWAAAQARIWADPDTRIAAARRLYRAQFPDHDIPMDTRLSVLRSLEGRLVKTTYARLAKQHRLGRFRRDSEASDPVNANLNLANGILYGLAASVCAALCLNPALGFIHEGNARAFIFDLADVFKPTVSIPAAFANAKADEPAKATARDVRSRLHSQRALTRMLALTQDLLDPDRRSTAEHGDTLIDDEGFVPGHTNWGDD